MTARLPGADDRSMRERMLAGDLYLADDPELGEGVEIRPPFLTCRRT